MQQFMQQQNPNQNKMQSNSYLMNNQQLYMQKMQHINKNRGSINPKINQGGFNLPSKNQDNLELVNKIKQIISIPNLEERKELLGETIFYFLLRFIPTFNLNQTSGKFSDDVLCSKLTGIFLNTDEKELVNILSNVEILVLTIKDVINVS